MNKIIRLFLIEFSWYIYTHKTNNITVDQFKSILEVCSLLTTNIKYKTRLESFIYEIQIIRTRDPTDQQRNVNNVTSYLVYKYFSNNKL